MTSLSKIKSIRLALMKKETDVDLESKAEYVQKISAKFVVPEDFLKNEETLQCLVTAMYENISADAPKDIDSLGIWIEYENTIVDNAISLQTLQDIEEYSIEKINPIYEFVKITLKA